MSFDTSKDTITVDGVTYDVDESTDQRTGTTKFTVERDGEPIFDGLTAEIGYEEDGSFANPRRDSNVSAMFVDYSGYELGDDDSLDPRDPIECPECKGSGENDEKWDVVSGRAYGYEITETVDGEDEARKRAETLNNKPVDGSLYDVQPAKCEHCKGDGERVMHPYEFYKKEAGSRVVMPLFIYEHSGITIRAGSPFGSTESQGRFVGDGAGWDTSFVGFIYDTPEGREQCIGEDATDEQIQKALEGEVEIYASYLEGDVTWYTVEDDETDIHDSCGGFVGAHGDYTKEEMFSSLEDAIVKRLAEIKERADMAARDIITVR